MNKPAWFLSISRFQGAPFIKPLAILLALLMLPPEFPVLGRFSLASKAKAQVTVCGNQATILQVCSAATNNFETEALSDYEKQYNLKTGDGNLIYTYGRTDLRMAFRAYMLDKLLAAINASPANRTPAEQAMIAYFQSAVQQHEIAQYTAATTDRDLFLQHLCQWVPDTDIEKAYNETVDITPYCGYTVTPITALFNGPPDMPTIDYFIAKGFKMGYQQPLETAVGGTTASLNLFQGGLAASLTLNQLQVAEMAALSSVTVLGAGVMTASRTIPALSKAIFPYRVSQSVFRGGKLGAQQAVSLARAAGTAIRVLGAVSVALEVVSTVVSVVFAILDAEEQQNEIDTLNSDLSNAKNNPPDLESFIKDTSGPGYDKLVSVFLEMTLPEYESSAPLPTPGANDPQFITNSASVTNHVGAITYQDQDNQIWTAQPYSQNWFLITGVDQNNNPVSRFSNYLTYLGPDTSNNITAYKAWINNGTFMVAKLLPKSNDQVCQAGGNGIYSGATTNCASFTPDHLTMRDVSGEPMNITMTQGVVFDSPNPANIAFTAGVGGTVTMTAHGIPAPSFVVNDPMPQGCYFLNYDEGKTTPGVTTMQLTCTNAAPPTDSTFSLIISNTASTVTVPFKLDVETDVHITSSTTFTISYGTPVNFVVTATGSQVAIHVPGSPWPEGITITDQGNGTATITGTPVPSNKLDGHCLELNNPNCNVIASNAVSTDTSPLNLTILTPPKSLTSPSQVTFRSGQYNEFVMTLNGGVTPAGVNVYRVADVCPSSDPSWLTETQRPNGDLLLSGTPPFVLNNQTYTLAFSVPLVGSVTDLDNCQYNTPFTLNVASYPIFPSTQYLIAQPGLPVPTNNFAMGSSFTSFSTLGTLPPGVSFGSDSADFFFTGTVPVTQLPGDYALNIDAQIVSNDNQASEVFHFIVGQPPTDQGFRYFNLVINQPANLLFNPAGFPKNAVGDLPAMTASFNINLSGGLTLGPGPMNGSMQITGTPTELSTLTGIFQASNGVAPDLEETVIIRVIKPGDINADGVVNCSDVSMVQAAMNSKLGLAGYSNLADVNGDGIVNSQDLLLVSKNLPRGTRCP